MRRSTLHTGPHSSFTNQGDISKRNAGAGHHQRDRHDLRVTQGSDGAIVVAGDLDVSSAGTLEQALIAAEQSRRADEPLVIDMHGVEFMDSSGLRTLVAASLRAANRGTKVALRSARIELVRLLEITGLREQFGLPEGTPGDRPWRVSGTDLRHDTRDPGRG